MANPNLNELLGTNIELFNNAWLQEQHLRGMGEKMIIIALEPWDRELTVKDKIKLYKLIDKYQGKILSAIKNKHGFPFISIENYLGV